MKYFLISILAALPVFPASFSTSIGFPSAPQAQGCSKSRIDNLTDSCSATLSGSQGSSLISIYSPRPNAYTLLGLLHVTQPSTGSATVKSSMSATLTEFSSLTAGGVRLTANCNSKDCEPVTVFANGVQIGTLPGGGTLYVPYSQEPLSIQLSAIEYSAPGIDYVGLIDITAVAIP
ncbi:MAG TPA: hypothetical protein VFT60_14885 [Bryobacteraceae bacterium]|nr:hypothetical protein [Bryobacteraceae bacterium]